MGINIGKAGLSVADRVDFFKTLAGWLSSGAGRMSVAEAVSNTTAGFSQDEYASLAPQMRMIQTEVSSGQLAFYQALRISNLGFQPQELAIIEAAERSNQLRQTLPSLVAALDVQNEGKRELVRRLTTPTLIAVLLISLTLGVLIFMLPTVINPVLERNPKAVDTFPSIVQFFWYCSVWLRAYYIFPSVILVTLIGLFLFRNTSFLQPYWLKFTFWWSVSRKMILGFNAMIVVYFLPALLRSGMPSYQALDQLAMCVNNPLLRSMLQSAAEDHRNGMRLSVALEVLPFRSSFVNAVVAGEATGALAERLEDLQPPYRMELERFIKQVAGTLQFTVMAVLLPLFMVTTYSSLVGPIFALMEFSRS